MFVNKHFAYLGRPSVHHVYVKTKMLTDFQIYISVPLTLPLLPLILFCHFFKTNLEI